MIKAEPTEKSAYVIFMPSGKRGHIEAGTSVLEAARKLGVDLDSVCGGRGVCSKCQVDLVQGDFSREGVRVSEDALSSFNAVEARYDKIRGLKAGRRLGCQAKIQKDAIIEVPPESQVHRQVVRKQADVRDIHMSPATRMYMVKVSEPDMHKPLGDFERLKQALKAEWGIENVSISVKILPKLQKILREGGWDVSVAIFQSHKEGDSEIIDIWPGLYEGGLYGFAVDLGSTTIAAHLTDLSNGNVVASGGVMNPQIRFGEDLMSRVSYAMMHEDGVAEMCRAVREGISTLLKEVAGEANIDQRAIVEMALVCNPVMHHLFLGIDPVELGQAPFALAVSESLTFDITALEISGLNSAAKIYVLPCIAGHVGADAAAVVLSESPHLSEDLLLVVDVGTNAEILLGNKDKLYAASSPTGPAFEGAEISSGQRAAPGAIEHVMIDPITKSPRFKVIGVDMWSDAAGFADAIAKTGVTGIAGSGIIEAIAEMRLAGLIDGSGLIGSVEQTGSQNIIPEGRVHAYVLYDGTEQGGPRISITQNDIRAIQLAKSALYAGIRLLMDELGVNKVDKVILAGAFGAHISSKHAMVLGMIPDVPLENVHSAGNAAGTGARIALCNREARGEIEAVVRDISKIETALAPSFQQHFVGANAIPHAKDVFEDLLKIVQIPDVSFGAGEHKNTRRRRRTSGQRRENS